MIVAHSTFMSNQMSNKASLTKNGGSDKAIKDDMNGSDTFSATGFTGNLLGLPSSTVKGSDEILGYGDSKSYSGLFVYNVIREAECMEFGSDIDYKALFEWVGATDSDNPYNINGVKKIDPKFASTVTASTAASSAVFS